MKPPYGWTVDPNGKERLIAYEPEAAVVRRIFQWAAHGASVAQISELLIKSGIPDPGERHSTEYMQRFFRHMRWQNPEVEAIIDRDLFEAAQKIPKIHWGGKGGK